MATPRISVVIVSYNFEKYIAECIESILAQTLPPFEIVIADDQSTDSSWNIICDYQRRHPELIKCYLQERNVGPAKNGNFAIRSAEGDLISVIDGDDRWLPAKLEREWVALAENPNARIAYSNVFTIDENGQRIGTWYDGTGPAPPSGDIFPEVWSWSCFPAPGYFYRHELMYRADWRELNFADEDVEIFLDLDFKIRATARWHAIYSGEALAEWRVHTGGIHNRPLEKVFKDLLLVYLKNFPLIASRSKAEERDIIHGIIERMFGLVAPIQTACVERLQLIERLDAECKQILQAAEERLSIIHRLEADNFRLLSRNIELQKICDERLAAIRELERVANAKSKNGD